MPGLHFQTVKEIVHSSLSSIWDVFVSCLHDYAAGSNLETRPNKVFSSRCLIFATCFKIDSSNCTHLHLPLIAVLQILSNIA